MDKDKLFAVMKFIERLYKDGLIPQDTWEQISIDYARVK